MVNAELAMSLDECVDEALSVLTGLDLNYDPSFDRYRVVTRQLNRALRANALEREWSYYASTEDVGTAVAGDDAVALRPSVRPRIVGDDSVRLTDDSGKPVVWASFLPRDALSKYAGRRGLWVAQTRQALHFSRPFSAAENGLHIEVPVMREPRMFRLPPRPETAEEPDVEVPDSIRNQLLDFDYPDLIIARAVYLISLTDPVMQPRSPQLEQDWKNIFYALNERDDRSTDSPYLNEWRIPVQGSIFDETWVDSSHPHADDRY